MTVAVVRRIRTVLVLVVFLAGAVWFLANRGGAGRQHFSAEFSDASELAPRNDVRLNDVIVGKVRSVTLDGLHAKVTFSVDDDVHLPAGTRAELRQVSLLGEMYVALLPEGDGELADGTNIPLSRTRRATDFEDLVGTGGELAAGLSVGNINRLVGGFTNAFADDPGKLGRFIDATAAASKAFNDSTPDLQATIDRVEQMAAQLRPDSQALATSIDQLAAGMKSLDAHRGDLGTFTTGLANFSEKMGSLLATNEARFAKGLPELKQVFGELQSSLGDVDRWLVNLYQFNASWACIGDGNYFNETFLLLPALASVDYGPGGCDPEKGPAGRDKSTQFVVEGVPGQQVDATPVTGGVGAANDKDQGIGQLFRSMAGGGG